MNTQKIATYVLMGAVLLGAGCKQRTRPFRDSRIPMPRMTYAEKCDLKIRKPLYDKFSTSDNYAGRFKKNLRMGN
jgi:hypothetical protein